MKGADGLGSLRNRTAMQTFFGQVRVNPRLRPGYFLWGYTNNENDLLSIFLFIFHQFETVNPTFYQSRRNQWVHFLNDGSICCVLLAVRKIITCKNSAPYSESCLIFIHSKNISRVGWSIISMTNVYFKSATRKNMCTMKCVSCKPHTWNVM